MQNYPSIDVCDGDDDVFMIFMYASTAMLINLKDRYPPDII